MFRLHAFTYIYIKSQWSARGITALVFRKCNIHRYIKLFYFTRPQSAEEEGGCPAAESCSAERERAELQGWEGKDAEGDVETISPSLARSLARFLLPASFQASVPQQLSEEKTNKSEKRQAGEGDVPPQESTCLVDLFLGTRCALTIP